nr:type II toxin-antitoxin system death-on-curing family toxin [Agromyces luteolus]
MPVFGEEVHPTLDEKAAALLVALMRNHPLADGNKRLAWFATVAFLELNELDLVVDDVAEADRFLREVAAGAVDLDAVAAWVRDRIRPLA